MISKDQKMMSHSTSVALGYAKSKVKSDGDKESPCCRQFWVGTVSSNCLAILTLLKECFH